MVRSASSRVSNHEAPMRPSFETALARLLRMRTGYSPLILESSTLGRLSLRRLSHNSDGIRRRTAWARRQRLQMTRVIGGVSARQEHDVPAATLGVVKGVGG